MIGQSECSLLVSNPMLCSIIIAVLEPMRLRFIIFEQALVKFEVEAYAAEANVPLNKICNV
jgi:hypothetical protein